MAGDRGDDLTGAAPSEAQRSDLQAGQFVKRASFTRSVKEPKPAIPGHGNGPLSCDRRRSRPDLAVLAVRHRDEGAALIAALASAPARPEGHSPATPCAPASAESGGEPA